MKKILLLLSLLSFVVNVNSQHLKYDGIPIDGTIAKFQSKLTAKGYTINSKESKEAPIGERVFNGKYRGYNSIVTVYYNRKTKNVYKVQVEIESKNINKIQNLYDETVKETL